MPDTANHAWTRRQARTDGGGGEKESSVPELCSLESVCGQACVYRHIARCVFTTIYKSKKLVALKQKLYLEKADALLSDSVMYEKVDITRTVFVFRVKAVLGDNCKNMDSKLLKSILPNNTRFPEFCGLPKDHKQNLPLRPVVSACDSPVTGISIILERILHQLLDFAPAHLPNTNEALDDICTIFPYLQAPEETILATLDVVGLYPSIPIEEGVNAVGGILEQHVKRMNMFGLNVCEVKDLLQFVLTNNLFRFGPQIFHQLEGVAMGNNLAPPFAILFMHSLETRLLADSPVLPVLYTRYIDDAIILWTHGEKRLLELIQHFNAGHDRLKFTYELSSSKGWIDTWT